MVASFAANMAPWMFGSLVVFLLIGFPVSFSLGACGLFYALVGIELGLMPASLMQALPLRIVGIMQNDTLLAIPFFTFMGLILERSGMAEDLLDTIGQLFGPIRGGLAYAVIFVGAMLAATTGVVAASVISMGLISLPIMLRHGYDRRVASGVIAASGTLAQIIPPSLVLIVLADQLGQSVGALYQGALMPALVLTGLYGVYVGVISVLRPQWVPAMPASARALFRASPDSGWRPRAQLCVQVAVVLIPPLALIFLVLGTIFLGIATPTEGGAMGATGALVIALARRRLDLPQLRQAMQSTARLSCFVLFILIGSTVFSLAFQAVDGPKWVEHLLAGLPGGVLGFLIVVNLLVFLLAFFLDFFELAFIVVPLLSPVAAALGIDMVWFGVLLAVNMQTSFMHPPFGFALFYLRSVAPDREYTDAVTGQRIAPVSIGQIYRGAIPFVLIQLAMVALIIAFPGLVSRGPDAATSIDPDAVLRQLQSEQNAADAASKPTKPDENAVDEDPMKALQKAVEAEREATPK
ncbi:MAG: TRAP transporter large permease subunit [Rhizobacter sp.]